MTPLKRDIIGILFRLSSYSNWGGIHFNDTIEGELSPETISILEAALKSRVPRQEKNASQYTLTLLNPNAFAIVTFLYLNREYTLYLDYSLEPVKITYASQDDSEERVAWQG